LSGKNLPPPSDGDRSVAIDEIIAYGAQICLNFSTFARNYVFDKARCVVERHG